MTTTGSGIIERKQPKKLYKKLISNKTTAALQLSKKIELFIQLSTPSVTQYINQTVITGVIKPTKKQEQVHAKLITTEQVKIHKLLTNIGVNVLSSMRVGVNGFRVKSSMSNIQSLLSIPGVISVSPVALHKLTLVKSVPWINAPIVWE